MNRNRSSRLERNNNWSQAWLYWEKDEAWKAKQRRMLQRQPKKRKNIPDKDLRQELSLECVVPERGNEVPQKYIKKLDCVDYWPKPHQRDLFCDEVSWKVFDVLKD